MRDTKLDAGDADTSLIDQLTLSLQQNWVKVSDLFREWDCDGDGAISAREFKRALSVLGLEARPDAMRYLFELIDRDNSGSITLTELSRAIRPSSLRAKQGELDLTL